MDCIDLFKRAAMALQTDSRYLAMDQARKMNDKDEELQNLIGEFNLARMDAEDERQKRFADEDELADAGFDQACRAMPRLRPRSPDLHWPMLQIRL